jgi:hypothetical protein
MTGPTTDETGTGFATFAQFGGELLGAYDDTLRGGGVCVDPLAATAGGQKFVNHAQSMDDILVNDE